ncbi:isochorismate synthase [Rubrobacter marinus]|uniref:Isochorismate synthase MenF n=1 Tax=Rubrobacter marinus TaxID=2653852 RepID=A0A6G8Q0T2_9ACTN|nr:isochorismate synthase [Rubrobacter marinus]QIN79927.1 isochorismate synthase [Rubrobacter marinus]
MLSRDYAGAIFERTDARRALAEEVGRVLEGNAGLTAEERIVRLEVPAGDLDPLRWLGSQVMRPRSFWSGREDGTAVAAVGVADVVEGDGTAPDASLRERLALLSSGARYYGGLRFDPERGADEEWGAFGAHRFVLPRFELLRRGDEATLACNLVLPRDAERAGELLDELEGLTVPEGWPGSDGPLPTPVSRVDRPDRAGWGENVRSALEAFEAGRMDKVVLARRVDLGFGEDLDAVSLMETLREATPGCFHFLVEPEDGAAFLGASPERLFRREGRGISSEAVAGTRPRGASEVDDAELREELLGSAKDQAEHSIVRVSIEESLGALCRELKVEDRASEMKLARGRHLVSRIRGILREGVSDADVLAALHPTPAVGGYPKGEAIGEIRALEPFDRGWYAGPIGWIGADGAEFAVGIRSGLVRGGRLSLYSGAGIVVGSTPDGEWAEIEQKISDFTRVFGLDPEERDARA